MSIYLVFTYFMSLTGCYSTRNLHVNSVINAFLTLYGVKIMAKSPVHDIDRHIGRRLKSLRQERAISAASLAELVGVTQQQISRYENGRTKINASQLYQIAVSLGVPISWFFLECELPSQITSNPMANSTTHEAARINEQLEIVRSSWQKLNADQRATLLKLLDTFLF